MNKSDRIEELELEVAVLKAQRDRVRKRLRGLENGCHTIGARISRMRVGVIGRRMHELLWTIADDLAQADQEFNRYYLEPTIGES